MVLRSCLLLPMNGCALLKPRSGDNRLEWIARLDQVESVCPCTNTHIDTQTVSSLDSVIPSSVPSPMCADAQTANLLSRKLIRSRSLDESLSTLETSQRPSSLAPFVLAKEWP